MNAPPHIPNSFELLNREKKAHKIAAEFRRRGLTAMHASRMHDSVWQAIEKSAGVHHASPETRSIVKTILSH